MPRIAHQLLLRARNISPLLPLLLRTCRSLPSARNELRWLRKHVTEVCKADRDPGKRAPELLLDLCARRGRGVPLQYLLGSHPFGELDILCRPGVLIPRSETEAYTLRLADTLCADPELGAKKGLRVLDLCTGTGCIPLLLYSLLCQRIPDIEVRGVDISKSALNLARDNLRHNIKLGHLSKHAAEHISFMKGDVLCKSFHPDGPSKNRPAWDILTANPPYISETGFTRDTERSVRNWEPKLALVPPALKDASSDTLRAEDIFYLNILAIAQAVSSRLVLMEVGDTEQALRVAAIAVDEGSWRSIEIWRDWPDQDANGMEEATVGQRKIPMRGSGHGRSVLCRR